MDRNLETYVKIYDNWIADNICDDIVDSIKDCSWQQHLFYDKGVAHNVSGDQELDVAFNDIKYTPFLNIKLEEAFDRYVSDFNFSWFGSFDGFSSIKFNRYSKNQLMAEHCDHIKSMFGNTYSGIPYLSCLFVLNDDYKGGEFVMWQDTTIELRKGDALLFPSNFLYPHKVLPVTEGTRYTCVSWFY